MSRELDAYKEGFKYGYYRGLLMAVSPNDDPHRLIKGIEDKTYDILIPFWVNEALVRNKLKALQGGKE